jgi:hypothetical protein
VVGAIACGVSLEGDIFGVQRQEGSAKYRHWVMGGCETGDGMGFSLLMGFYLILREEDGRR